MAHLLSWMQFYPIDWLQDREVKKLKRAARSFYFDMLCHEWIGGPLPDDPVEVAGILDEFPRSLSAHWSSIRQRFDVDSNGKLVHWKLEKLRNEALLRSQQSANAAKERWSRNATALLTPDATALPIQHITSQSHTQEEQKKPANAASPVGDLNQGPLHEPEQKPEEPKQERGKPLTPKQELKGKGANQVIAYYCDRWKEVCKPADGKHPKMGAAEVKAAESLLSYGLDEAKRYIDLYFADGDSWLIKNGYGLRLLPKRLEAYRATSSPQRQFANFQQPMAAVSVGGEDEDF